MDHQAPGDPNLVEAYLTIQGFVGEDGLPWLMSVENLVASWVFAPSPFGMMPRAIDQNGMVDVRVPRDLLQ